MKQVARILIALTITTVALNAEAGRKSRGGSSGSNYQPTLSGSAANDDLVGSSSSDVIAGLNGDDWIDGKAGDDVLIGGNGGDTFVLRAGGGNDVIADFTITYNLSTTDKILFDIGGGVYDGYLAGWNNRYDGEVFQNSNGSATFTITSVDANGDGIIDTRIQANSDSITLLSVKPSDLHGYLLTGG